MNREIQELLSLQGEMKVALVVRFNFSQEIADDVAAEMLHLAATSPVAAEAHRSVYAKIAPPDATQQENAKP